VLKIVILFGHSLRGEYVMDLTTVPVKAPQCDAMVGGNLEEEEPPTGPRGKGQITKELDCTLRGPDFESGASAFSLTLE
jgi:hypothetical protein